ncbi:MAG: hypothetical protein WB014_14590 [Methanosarcina sp.]
MPTHEVFSGLQNSSTSPASSIVFGEVYSHTASGAKRLISGLRRFLN